MFFLMFNIPYQLLDDAKYKPKNIRAKTVFLNLKQETLRVVTITMICSTLASS